jgi:hypothetical protein
MKRRCCDIERRPPPPNYLPGFQKRVTNARGFATTFAFQAFDVPSEDAITAVWVPEGSTLSIVRDVFGKPLSIARSDLPPVGIPILGSKARGFGDYLISG